MQIVTGLGGIFLKANNPKYLARWYEDNLGIGFRNSLYFNFKWREIDNESEVSQTVFSFFKDDTSYFYPGTNEIMINFRVCDLDKLRIDLRNDKATVIDKIESYEYGRFGWVLDPEGNKIELWEPVDEGFEDRNYPMDLKNISGLGGVSIKCSYPDKLMNWYNKHFGLFFNNSIHTFQSKNFSDKKLNEQTSLSFLPESTIYFQPSVKNYMLNFRVNDLKKLIFDLRESEEIVCDRIEEFEFGKFGWVLDPENNKIELWEPEIGGAREE